MNNIKGIIFDLDGVITNTARYHYLAWKVIASELGIIIDEKFNESLKGLSREKSLDEILKKGGCLEKYSILEKEALLIQKNEIYLKKIKNLTEDDILDGVRELIKKLKLKNIKLGVASASKNASLILKQLNIYDEFDYIAELSSELKSKPAPDIFLDVAKKLKLEPCECIGIEDSIVGVQAIKKANMFAIGIGEKIILKSAGADIIFLNIKNMLD